LLAEKYILKGTGLYKKLSNFFSYFDNFFNLKPLRWFAIWTAVVSGSNVPMHLQNRWIYWNWDSFSFYLLFALLISSIIDFIFTSKLDNNINYSPYFEQLIIFGYGSALFLLGANPINLSFNLLIFGFPYVLFFLAGYIIWKIPLNTLNSSLPIKRKLILPLVFTASYSAISSIIGFMNDDPMISTMAAVFLPFPLVAIFFPVAIRHLQRCRMYVVFIPAMFLSMRYPWFLFIIFPLFLFSRYYFYFTSGEVLPTFKVNNSDHEILK
jgi:hypothetical protein